MKAICILNESDAIWTRKYFGCGPGLVPILNKPLVEYFFDFFELLGIKDVRISQDEAFDGLQEYCTKKQTAKEVRFLNLSFALHKNNDSLQDVLLKNAQFLFKESEGVIASNGFGKEYLEDVLIFRGFAFIHYSKNNVIDFFSKRKIEPKKLSKSTENLYFNSGEEINIESNKPCLAFVNASLLSKIFNYNKTTNEKFSKSVSIKSVEGIAGENKSNVEANGIRKIICKTSVIKNLQDYFYLSMQLLKKEKNSYVFSGHYRDSVNAGETGKMLSGKGLQTSSTTEVQSGAMLGNYVKLRRRVSIGSGCILGNYSLVDEGTILQDVIVLNGAYVGRDLFLNEAIISGEFIIKPIENEILALDDALIVARMPEKKVIIRAVYRSFSRAVAFILLPLTVVSHVLGFIIKIQKLPQKFIFEGQDGKEGKEIFVPIKKNNLSVIKSSLQAIFFRFSCDKFLLLPDAVKGKLWISGNTPLPATFAGRKRLLQLNQYRPAVFTFADAFKSNAFTSSTREKEVDEKDKNYLILNEVNELYFSHHFNLYLLITIIFRSFFLRLLTR